MGVSYEGLPRLLIFMALGFSLWELLLSIILWALSAVGIEKYLCLTG